MASEGSNPFAGGLVVADESRGPRPAGRLGVFLWAIFVIALGDPQQLWSPFPRELLGEDKNRLAGFVAVTSIPLILSPLWAYLSDRVAVMATRREGYLLLGGVLSIGGWAVAPFIPQEYGWWLLVSVVLGLGFCVARVAAQGALVEIGRRVENAGLLAASLVGLRLVAGLVSWPVSEVLNHCPLGWTAACGAALAISIVLIVGMLSDEENDSGSSLGADSPAPRPLWDDLRSNTLWAGLAIVSLAGLGTSPLLIMKIKQVTAFPDETWSILERGSLAASLFSALAYGILSRWVNARRLVSVSFLAGTFGTLSLYALDQDPSSEALGLVLAARAFGIGLVGVALVDVAFRAAPRGREALGFVLITGAPVLLGAPIVALVMRTNLPTIVALLAALIALAAMATSRAPRALFGSRSDGPSFRGSVTGVASGSE